MADAAGTAAGAITPEDAFALAIETSRRDAVACAERAFMTATKLATLDRALFDREAAALLAEQIEVSRWGMVERGIDAPALLDHVRRAITQSFEQRKRELLRSMNPLGDVRSS